MTREQQDLFFSCSRISMGNCQKKKKDKHWAVTGGPISRFRLSACLGWGSGRVGIKPIRPKPKSCEPSPDQAQPTFLFIKSFP
jgi:hypothetical protein